MTLVYANSLVQMDPVLLTLVVVRRGSGSTSTQNRTDTLAAVSPSPSLPARLQEVEHNTRRTIQHRAE